jgi:DNA-binding NtrC family response regulator
MTSVLIVDDEPGIRFTLRDILEGAHYTVDEAAHGADALALAMTKHYPLIISDLVMPEMDGMALLANLVKNGYTGKVIFLTARGSERHAVTAMKAGAYDYLTKPFDVDELLIAVAKAVESDRLISENRELKAHLFLGRTMVFKSKAMIDIASAIERIADKEVMVLITGESGTGKELICQAIHEQSRRNKGPLIKFSCAAVPDTLIEATLFGHERGAYTGADQARPGCFREAQGGTLLLDEIGELSAIGQTRLLRVLEAGEIQPVGGKIQKVDVRVIAATNRNLEESIAKGTFRADLYYRLKVVQINIPPLRDRPEDIPLLIDHFTELFREKFNMPTVSIAAAIREKLIQQQWPGNARELKHALERLIIFSVNGIVDEKTLPPEDTEASVSKMPLTLKERVDTFEKRLIQAALEHCNGNQSHAARHLGIGRATLIDKIKKFGQKESG